MTSLSYRKKNILFKILFYFLLYSTIIGILFPFIIMVLASFMSESELVKNVYPNFSILPKSKDSLGELLQNYKWFWGPAGKKAIVAFFNSIKFAIPTTIIVVILASLAAYSISRSKLKGRNIFLFFILFTSMVPTMAMLIPLYLQWIKFGLYDTIPGIIIVIVAFLLPYTIWIMKSFFDTIPFSIEEAALIDGCTRFNTLIKVVIPLSLPGIGAVAVISFISAWATFLIPLILTKADAQVFNVFIALFVNSDNVEISKVMTSGVVSAIPVVLLALLLQRLILRGLIEGGVKG